jgi:hypothetical protein
MTSENIVVAGQAATPVPEPTMTYVEWLAGEIRTSAYYVGDGGFIAQAMLADTLEEATSTEPMLSADQNTGKPFRFLTATFADSDLDGRLPFFAVCDVIDTTTGERGKLSCGGGRVVATLFRACQRDWFPFEATIEPVSLGAGKNALNIVPAPIKVANKTK